MELYFDSNYEGPNAPKLDTSIKEEEPEVVEDPGKEEELKLAAEAAVRVASASGEAAARVMAAVREAAVEAGEAEEEDEEGEEEEGGLKVATASAPASSASSRSWFPSWTGARRTSGANTAAAAVTVVDPKVAARARGRGLRSSTSQLDLSHSSH